MNDIKLGNKIKEKRIEYHLTMEKLGEIVGVSKSTISKWESGNIKNLKRNNIEALSKALHCSPLYLLDEQDEEVTKLANQTYWNIKLNEIIMDFNDEQMEKLCDYAELLALKKR